MTEPSERVEQFRAEIASMRLKDPATRRETLLLRFGAVAMGAGIAVGVVAFFLSHGATDPRDQTDDVIIALASLSVAVVGTGLWLRYSAAAFLRFWLARLIYEQRFQTDRLLAGDEERGG